MITNNFKKVMQYIMGDPFNKIGLPITFKSTDGNNITMDYLSNSNYAYVQTMTSLGYLMSNFYKSSVQNRYDYFGVYFGDNGTTANEDDYMIRGTVLNNKIDLVKVLSHSIVDDTLNITAAYTIKNTSSESISIKEIGLIGRCSSSFTLLLDRTLLDEPLTLATGETGEITYTMENTWQHSTATTQ